ncbi:ARM repeat-containing protein [Neolentinus lepideus HHB14362 ss-1]|uniref:Sister chromatid cohesion protein n=1 Tax=Neolentinus lepideus HHB14362 ss-1 TaxID=1314782 RepID=A0A165NRB4_9AGAM|nr:ARM repeat-containing protein [Neolentinus lepideus HHB14362 ss-1]
MNGSGWYTPHDMDRQPYGSPDTSLGRAAADSVQDAHKLFNVYPLASATPSTHVARHLSNLTITANSPSYIQPLNYNAHTSSGLSSSYAPFPEYSTEFNHLTLPEAPSEDGGYWADTRNDAMRYLGGASSAYSHYPPNSWVPSPSHTSYYSNAFAHSVFQHTAPSASYPTPPPPGISASSSSLAYALVEPKPKSCKPTYRPEDSQQFFNNFLSQTGEGIQATQPVVASTQAQQRPRTPMQQKGQKAQVVQQNTYTPVPASRQQVPPQQARQAMQSLHQHARTDRTTYPHFQPVQQPQVRKSSQATDAYIHAQPVTPIRRKHAPPQQSSPDPLDIGPTSSIAHHSHAITPLKRKSTEEMVPAFTKKLLSSDSFGSPLTQPSQSSSNSSPSKPPRPQPFVLVPTLSHVDRSKSITPKASALRPQESKPKLQAYVELSPLPKAWMTPTSKRDFSTPGSRMDVDDDDLGGFGPIDDSPTKGRGHIRSVSSNVKSSAKRTGDRDDRVPLEKLGSLFEDIFEAEDALPPDASIQDIPVEFFSALTVEDSQPLLHPNLIRKLTKYIGKVARPTKRLRLSAREANGGTPRAKGGVAELEVPSLSRILKMLERNVKAGVALEPFGNFVPSADRKSGSPSKSKASKKSSKGSKKTGAPDSLASLEQGSATGADDATESVAGESVQENREVTEADLDHLTRILETARDSILAADCCIALLASDRLPKQLYSEELITECFNTIKNQLTKILYPFVEATSDLHGNMHPLLRHMLDTTSSDAREHRQMLGELFQALSAVLPRVNNLICAEVVAMSESIIIQAVYIAIGPFFVADAGGDGDAKGKGKKENIIFTTLGSSAMRGLRLDALSLIRSIFANHEDQRSWIVEEILSSLIKLSDVKQKVGQFRLRDGRSIRTVSALLLQLVQTSSHDVRVEARKLGKARQQALALHRQDSLNEPSDESFLDETDNEEIRLYTSGLESATKVAKTVVLFLTQRSGKTKTTKNSNEAEYRAIFDNLISDMLVVLWWPEWPAAALLLSVICKFMVTSLDDIKTSNQNENNAAKTIALDHLGVIAARLRSSVLKYRKAVDGQQTCLRPLDEILPDADIKQFGKLLSAHHDVVAHLCKRSSEDQAYDSARELTAVAFGHELAFALKQLNSWIQPDEEFDPKVDRTEILPFAQKIKSALRDVWKDPATDVFDVGSQDEVIRVDRLAEEIGTIQGLRNSFHPILNKILLSLDAPPVFIRSKALRALGQIVTSDPTILSSDNVRRAIESHLLDSSPAVRDAAVELIGKYMVDSPEVAGNYYQKIADRIADTGLGVRKRVIKLLKAFYGVVDDLPRRVDICTKLVLRMFDEDDSVKELAVKAIEELWFQHPVSISSQSSRSLPVNPRDKSVLLSKVSVIMGVAANFKDRQSPLEDVLHTIMVEKEGTEAAALHERYTEICETLIDGLVDASDLPGFSVVNCVRTIYLFTSAYPAILSGAHASTLLPYLKNAATPEEQVTSDYLLKIFRASVPHMPKTAAQFGADLQQALQPMIIKPSSAGGVQTLQETVACACAVVTHLTHDFMRLVALLKSCNARLQQHIVRPPSKPMTPVEARALNILVFLVALLGEHCDFDRVRTENETLAADLNSISEGSIVEHIYLSLLSLYQKYSDTGLRGRLLQCLGFLFRAQPTLMTLESSASVMDDIFGAVEEEPRARLLKIIQDFLISEATKHSSKEKENAKSKSARSAVNMEELIGNTDGFADSGVSSAVVQRYLDPILQAALSQNVQVQAPAVDILSFTIKQGLAHPLQSFPVIIALETSPNGTLANRAAALHHILHTKHTSLLNARYVVSARASFDYQKKISQGNVQGFRMHPSPTALLQRWYSLVREKRVTKLDFLKALTKVFDVPASLQCSQEEVEFIRYMAENFAAFDYKVTEEVLVVIKHLTSVLSTAGMQLVEVLSPSHLLMQLRGEPQLVAADTGVPMDVDIPAQTSVAPAPSSAPIMSDDKLPVLRTSVIIAIIMLLKAHLKSLYSLSEEKCSKWVPGKKSALGDRPATKRHEHPIPWDRLPFATRPVITLEDMENQRSKFLDIWMEDGVTAEPEDDFS